MKQKILLGVVIGVVFLSLVVTIIVLAIDKRELEEDNKKEETINEFDTSQDGRKENVIRKYLHHTYMDIGEYDDLKNYPIIYEDVASQFNAKIVKILEDDGKYYSILVSMHDDEYYYNPDKVEEPNRIVVKGEYLDSRKLKVNDRIIVYGYYRGVDPFIIDGEEKQFPRVMADKVVIEDMTLETPIYSIEEIRNIAQYFFKTKDITVVEPYYDPDDPKEQELMGLPYHYIVTVNDVVNAKFQKYRFFTGFGLIQVATEDEDGLLSRTIDKTFDEKNFILITYTNDDKRLEFDVYNENFKLVWYRAFEDVETYRYDNNNGRIVLNVNSDTYVLNESDGEDVIEPVMTGAANQLLALRNGDFVLVSKEKSDFMMFVDKKGKIIWKKGISREPQSIQALIVANEKIYVNYSIGESNRYVSSVYEKDGSRVTTTFYD